MDLKQKSHVVRAGDKLYKRVNVISDDYDPQWFVSVRDGPKIDWEQLPYPGHHDEEDLQADELEKRFQQDIQ